MYFIVLLTMKFLFPAFLIASLAIAIPIIIHLFNFRRYKKVHFTNVAFLKAIQQSSNSRKKINKWLVLLLRCLAVLAIVFAFAQPYFETKGKITQGVNYNILYLDNSFSMGSVSTDHNLLEEGKDIALQIINGYGADDKFMILTNDNQGIGNSWLNKEEVVFSLKEKITSPQVKTFGSIFHSMQQSFKLAGQGKHNAFFISDFQENTADLNSLKDTSIQVNLVPIQTTTMSNAYIDTAYFKDLVSLPGVANKLVYKVVNDGSKSSTIKPILKFNGSNKPLPIIQLGAGKSIIDTVPILSTGSDYQSAELVINDNPINFDDNYFIAWKDVKKANVLIINENNVNRYLTTALESSRLFNVANEEISRVNFSRFSSFPLIVLNELKSVSTGLISELKKAIDNGTNIVIFPNAASPGAINQLSQAFGMGTDGQMVTIESKVQSINKDDVIFQNVFEGKTIGLKLPVTQRNLKINAKMSSGAISLLTYRDGYPFLVKYGRGIGKVYLCAAPIDPLYSDLVKNGEVLVPFLFKAGFSSLRPQVAFTIGKNESFEINQVKDGQDGILKFNGPQTFIPEQLQRNGRTIIQLGNESILPGVYSLENFGLYAFNYDRKESRMRFLSLDNVKSIENDHIKVWDKSTQQNLASIIHETDLGLVLWKYLLVAALLFLLAETYFIRKKG
jgi:hypothetical protein